MTIRSALGGTLAVLWASTALCSLPARADDKPAAAARAADEPMPFLIVTDRDTVPTVPDPRVPPRLELRVRPVKNQRFHIFAYNPSRAEQEVLVSFRGEGIKEVKSAKTKVSGNKAVEITLPRPEGEAKGVRLTNTKSAFQLRLEALDEKGTMVEAKPWTAVPISIHMPTQYLDIGNPVFTPARGGEPNQLVVPVRALQKLNPPCKLELAIRPDRLPSLFDAERDISAKEQLTNAGQTVELKARNLKFKSDTAAETSGTIYLNVDGYTRGIVLQTNLGSVGTPYFRRLETPLIHVQAAPARYYRPGTEFPATIEVDDASPRETSVAIGILAPGEEQPQEKKVFDTRRDVEMTLEPIGSEGELSISTTVKDWTWTWPAADTKGLSGQYRMVAWMPDRREVVGSAPVFLIDSAPTGIVLSKPIRIPGKPGFVRVEARVTDQPKLVQSVTFYAAKPEGGNPPAGAEPINGVRPDPRIAVWTADIPFAADRREPLDIGVIVTNKVRLSASRATTYVPRFVGTLVGTVYVGEIPQPGLRVTAVKPAPAPGGKDKLVGTETDQAGRYAFADLEPGTYTVSCAKVAAFTRSDQKVITVEADQEKVANLNLLQK